MAVAHDAASESHTGTTASTSEVSFSWSHTPVGTPRGVTIFVIQATATSVDDAGSVTYGGTAVSAVTGGIAFDTVTELGACKAYHLGASIPTGVQTVVVNRTNSANSLYAVCITQTASGDTQVHLAGIVLLQEDQALAEQSVTDGSPGSNSVRYAGVFAGGINVPAAGANSTAVHSIDLGPRTMAVVRETTAGQGSRSIGFSEAVSDDVAAVHLAVREITAAATNISNMCLMGVG